MKSIFLFFLFFSLRQEQEEDVYTAECKHFR